VKVQVEARTGNKLGSLSTLTFASSSVSTLASPFGSASTLTLTFPFTA